MVYKELNKNKRDYDHQRWGIYFLGLSSMIGATKITSILMKEYIREY